MDNTMSNALMASEKFGDIRDRMGRSCPMDGYDCTRNECEPTRGGTCTKLSAAAAAATVKAPEKVWGATTPLIVTPMFEMHRLVIKPWHRCSFHDHAFKHNAFYVIEGVLFIDCESSPGAKFPTRLLPHESFTVKPGVAHQFRTGERPCIALEMYYTEPLSEDIRRFNVGSAL